MNPNTKYLKELTNQNLIRDNNMNYFRLTFEVRAPEQSQVDALKTNKFKNSIICLISDELEKRWDCDLIGCKVEQVGVEQVDKSKP